MRLFLAVALAVSAFAQSPIRQWRTAHEVAILDEFAPLLRVPNITRDLPNLKATAQFIQEMYLRHGVELRMLQVPDAAPALFGELRVPGATKTVVFYAHYDGQPVDAAQWINKAPFQPEMRDAKGALLPWPKAGTAIDPEWRLYGRSSGDDKAAIMALASALDALKAAGRAPGVNVKFFFEGEEETNWPHLPQILEQNKDLLKADGWLLCDGPVHPSRRQQIILGARTQLTVNLTVYGAKSELHGGHYGNWAPNPALMLVQLIASMKDEDGHVRIRGFYDDVAPLTPAERAAIRAFPNVDTLLRDEFAIGGVEVPGRRIEEAITEPALSVRNINAGGPGGVIPAQASALFRVDLVKGMDPAKTLEQVKAHIRGRGYTLVDHAPSDAERRANGRLVWFEGAGNERAERTPIDSPFVKQVVAAIESARGPVLTLPNMGAGIPLAAIHQLLGVPVVMVPIANHDDNQHTHNENLRLQNLWDGIETMAALMTMK